jgi:hypothetical protein
MIGQQLKSGWTIRALKPTLSTGTGGCFSYCFLATNDQGEEAFVKILDIKLDETLDEPLVDLQTRIQKFTYESDIALSCADQRLSRVAHASIGASSVRAVRAINTPTCCSNERQATFVSN